MTTIGKTKTSTPTRTRTESTADANRTKTLAKPATTAASTNPALPNNAARAAVGADTTNRAPTVQTDNPPVALRAGLQNGTAPRQTPLEESRARTDGLEAELRRAQEHEREPDLTTAKNNLGDHIENDYLPQLQEQRRDLGMEMFRAVEHGQPTDGIQTRMDENAAEIERATGLLDEARGAPITGADSAGVFEAPPGFDLQNPPASFSGRVTAPNGVSYDTQVQASDTTTAGPNGEEMRTLSITRSGALGVAGEGDIGAVGVQAGAFRGEAMTYEMQIPEADYQRILAGDAPFPDPGRLSTLPPGSSVTIRQEDFQNSELGGSYGAFQIGSNHSTAEGNAIRLEVGEDAVRVLAGPYESVTNGAALGLGVDIGSDDFKLGGSVQIGGSTTLTEGTMAFADISRDSGQGAYEDFLSSGEVPPVGTTGVRTGGTVTTVDINSSSAIGGQLDIGPLTLGGTLLDGRSVNGSHTTINYNDGSSEVAAQVEEGGVTAFANASYDASGRQTDLQQGVVLDNVDSSYQENFAQALGVEPGPRGDYQVSFDDQSYAALRDRTFDALAQRHPWSSEPEMLDALRAGPNDSGIYETASGVQFSPSLDPAVSAIVTNESMEGFLQDPSIRHGGSTTFADDLLGIWADTMDQGALPGTHNSY